MGSIPGLGRSPGVGNVNPIHILTWRIPWTEQPGGLHSMGSQRVRHNWRSMQSSVRGIRTGLQVIQNQKIMGVSDSKSQSFTINRAQQVNDLSIFSTLSSDLPPSLGSPQEFSVTEGEALHWPHPSTLAPPCSTPQSGLASFSDYSSKPAVLCFFSQKH